jgi:hypothetical protein
MVETHGSMMGKWVDTHTFKCGAELGEMARAVFPTYDASILWAVTMEMPKNVAVSADEVSSSRRGGVG